MPAHAIGQIRRTKDQRDEAGEIKGRKVKMKIAKGNEINASEKKAR
jgi:hypothetical protein